MVQVFAEFAVSSLVFSHRQVLFHPLWDSYSYVFNISLVYDVYPHATVVNQKFYGPFCGLDSAQ